jgi:hypothetical protein
MACSANGHSESFSAVLPTIASPGLETPIKPDEADVLDGQILETIPPRS